MKSFPSQAYGYLLCCGVFGVVGQVLLTLGIQVESAGHVAVVRNLDLPLNFVLQSTVIGTMPGGIARSIHQSPTALY